MEFTFYYHVGNLPDLPPELDCTPIFLNLLPNSRDALIYLCVRLWGNLKIDRTLVRFDPINQTLYINIDCFWNSIHRVLSLTYVSCGFV